MIHCITVLAIRWVRWQLRKDKDWYRSYQSNIAMAFYDECSRNGLMKVRGKNYKMIYHAIANKAATNFMDTWIKK